METIWPKLISHVIYYRAVATVHAGESTRPADCSTTCLIRKAGSPDDAAQERSFSTPGNSCCCVHPSSQATRGRAADSPCRAGAWRRSARSNVNWPYSRTKPAFWSFAKTLYADLQEAEYSEAAKTVRRPISRMRYAEELGHAMIAAIRIIGGAGAEFLRMAANGRRCGGRSIFAGLAEAYAKAGETAASDALFASTFATAGLEVGLPNLPPDQRTIYFNTVKRLADEAAARDELDEAIYNYSLATQRPRQRRADFARLGRNVRKKERHLQRDADHGKGPRYDGRDPDLLAKKDKYYYSLEPAERSPAREGRRQRPQVFRRRLLREEGEERSRRPERRSRHRSIGPIISFRWRWSCSRKT